MFQPGSFFSSLCSFPLTKVSFQHIFTLVFHKMLNNGITDLEPMDDVLVGGLIQQYSPTHMLSVFLLTFFLGSKWIEIPELWDTNTKIKFKSVTTSSQHVYYWKRSLHTQSSPKFLILRQEVGSCQDDLCPPWTTWGDAPTLTTRMQPSPTASL